VARLTVEMLSRSFDILLPALSDVVGNGFYSDKFRHNLSLGG
jgi:hypothetical protein